MDSAIKVRSIHNKTVISNCIPPCSDSFKTSTDHDVRFQNEKENVLVGVPGSEPATEFEDREAGSKLPSEKAWFIFIWNESLKKKAKEIKQKLESK